MSVPQQRFEQGDLALLSATGDSRALAERLASKWADRITGHVLVPGRAGSFQPFPDSLPPALAAALRARGMAQLYSHQGQAWEAIERGEHVVVVTPTASG